MCPNAASAVTRTSGVHAVCHHTKNVLYNICVIKSIEVLRCLIMLAEVLEHCVEDVQTNLTYVTHRVLERPDDRV